MSTADDRLHLVAEMIVAHTRVRPPSGDCSCGDTVPLGHSFAVHQADHILRALEQADHEHDPRCISLLGDGASRIFCDCKTLALIDRYSKADATARRCGACRDLSDTHVEGCDGTWGR